MRARLVFGCGVLLVFIVVAASVKAEGEFTGRGLINVGVALVIYGVLLLTAGLLKVGAHASRLEEKWAAQHREDGDPR